MPADGLIANIARSDSDTGWSVVTAENSEATACGDADTCPYTWIRLTGAELGEDMRESLRWCR